jgi:pectinesterase
MRTTLLPLVFLACAAATGFARDITLAPDGSGDFHTLQEALDSLPAANVEPVHIFLKPGKYEQYLTIPKGKDHLTFTGKGAKPDETLLSFHYKASDPKPGSNPPTNIGTTGSASTTINSSDCTFENLTFENSAGDNVGQAVALKTNGDRLIFRNCRFLGFQDTLYPAGGGRCYFVNCYITGDTDFIFGNATAVFDHCTINASDPRLNYYTAANTQPKTPFGYVFLDCQLTASPGVQPGAVYLGRPWQWDRGSSAAVAFIRCTMGPHVNPEGWHPWAQTNVHPENNTRYREFGSVDPQGKPLDVSKRVSWSHQLTAEEAAEYTPEKILAGTDHWNPR